jgi:predicted dehydrogenase
MPVCKTQRWGVGLREISFGLVGAGYMGKAHSIALKAVGTVFNTALRPVCEMIATTTAAGAAAKAKEFGFNRSTGDWRQLVADPAVEAIIIASPQATHREIALAALAAGKPVFCEKPLGTSLDDARAMEAAAARAGVSNMTGFNYIRTPASQLARQIILNGDIGRIVYVRAEHTEDFLADPATSADWRTRGAANGNMGDLSPHIINAVLRLAGPIETVVGDMATIHRERRGPSGTEPVTNDDQAHFLCRFAGGAMGSVLISRIATGRKMGYAYEITGTTGAIRFDQEDQNALWLYDGRAPAGRRGFTKILTAPEHPDYAAFCDGAGHGTGYNDQIIIEARDFLSAIETGRPVFPTFGDGVEVSRVIAAVVRSNEQRAWVRIDEV